jgi:hypothetical protein
MSRRFQTFRTFIYPTETPINLPMPYVSAAAAMPTSTWRVPENMTLLPVINVIAAPMMNKPTALITRLSAMASVPLQKK